MCRCSKGDDPSRKCVAGRSGVLEVGDSLRSVESSNVHRCSEAGCGSGFLRVFCVCLCVRTHAFWRRKWCVRPTTCLAPSVARTFVKRDDLRIKFMTSLHLCLPLLLYILFCGTLVGGASSFTTRSGNWKSAVYAELSLMEQAAK